MNTSNFKRSIRDARSGGWIALHRAVEALARTTGEPFTQIFERLEKKHQFRRSTNNIPRPVKMNQIADQLESEFFAWKTELKALEAVRMLEKKNGRRKLPDGRLKEMIRQREAHVVPQVGYWGWRERRK